MAPYFPVRSLSSEICKLLLVLVERQRTTRYKRRKSRRKQVMPDTRNWINNVIVRVLAILLNWTCTAVETRGQRSFFLKGWSWANGVIKYETSFITRTKSLK